MSESKAKRLNEILDEVTTLTTEMEEKAENDTRENREKLDALIKKGDEIRLSIERDAAITGLKNFMDAPANAPKSSPQGSPLAPNGDGVIAQPFTGIKSIGEQFVESDGYKAMTEGGKVHQGRGANVLAKGFLHPAEQKATFTTSLGGLTSGQQYYGGIIDVRQQRLTIRDLLPVAPTTLNSVAYIKETSFTNGATAVAEEGTKPEASFDTDPATAPVKKIAVIGRVTDEMFADFPMMREYVNQRLRFMIEAREEAQLYAGTGTGANLTGITATSGIQTQAKSTDSNFVAIHKAITKVRTVGFAEPDAIVIHPTDWQILKISTDANTQFYGSGPFEGQYGAGNYNPYSPIWGLRPVITTAATAGTALVGAFRDSAMIFQREGITVATTDTDASDWANNRVAIRVEERLALAVFRPLGFCTVTGIA